MTQVSYPGVYVQEVPSGVRTIAPVSTSISAFIDFFREGPMNEAVEIDGKAGFDRVFGGLDSRSEASYAIDQFFTNGGTKACVVRVASGEPAAASATVRTHPPAGVGRPTSCASRRSTRAPGATRCARASPTTPTAASTSPWPATRARTRRPRWSPPSRRSSTCRSTRTRRATWRRSSTTPPRWCGSSTWSPTRTGSPRPTGRSGSRSPSTPPAWPRCTRTTRHSRFR